MVVKSDFYLDDHKITHIVNTQVNRVGRGFMSWKLHSQAASSQTEISQTIQCERIFIIFRVTVPLKVGSPLQLTTPANYCMSDFVVYVYYILSSEQGVPQGDVVSPYIFILAVEILLIKINHTKNLKGITYAKKESRSETFADDTSIFIQRNPEYLRECVNILKQFANISGLQCNLEKTSVLFWRVIGLAHFLCLNLKSLSLVLPFEI